MASSTKRWTVSRITYLAPMEVADRLLVGLWRHWLAGMRHAALTQAFGTCPDERTLVLLERVRDVPETTAVGNGLRWTSTREIGHGQSCL
jgi:hypothetical protein